jgi:hypothetical protein
MFYLFSMILATSTPLFSNQLGYSWLSFMPSFLQYCTTGDFSCTYGNLLSPAICWAGATILFLILIKIIGKCCKSSAKFQPFYNLFKGLYRWCFGPLIYYSCQILIISLQNKNTNSNFIASIVVLGYYAVYCLI